MVSAPAKSASRVAFPFYWDFENRVNHSRFTLALPLYARYRKGDNETNVLGNVVWTRGRSARCALRCPTSYRPWSRGCWPRTPPRACPWRMTAASFS